MRLTETGRKYSDDLMWMLYNSEQGWLIMRPLRNFTLYVKGFCPSENSLFTGHQGLNIIENLTNLTEFTKQTS